MAQLRVENLSKIFSDGNKETRVLCDVFLSLDRGEKIGIIGASGAGKSTLLHIMAGLEGPSGGKVLWEGEDLFALSDRERSHIRNQRVGFIFQFYHLLPELTALENVMLPPLIAGLSFKEAKERGKVWISFMDLDKREGHLPSQLSGGEQQRVAIARALAPLPKLLLLDEPFSAIDQPLRVQIRGEIQQLAQEIGIPIILVTHDQEEATAISQHLVYFDEGELIEEGRPEDLYLHPRKVRTAKFFTDNVLIPTESGEIYCFKPWELRIEESAKGRGKWKVVGSLFYRGKYLISVNSLDDDKSLQVESESRLTDGT